LGHLETDEKKFCIKRIIGNLVNITVAVALVIYYDILYTINI
jgi:hypothetical protein